MGDEKRSASDAELEVPSEGEQECKKAKIISKLWVPGRRNWGWTTKELSLVDNDFCVNTCMLVIAAQLTLGSDYVFQNVIFILGFK